MKNNTKIIAITSTAFSAVMLLASVSPAFAGYGSSPSTNTASAPVCNNAVPGKAAFSFVRKSGASQIEIGWNPVVNASSWTVAYGIEPGKYIYGMANFGDANSRSVDINMLPQGTYYAVVKANNGCMPGAFSDERKITVTAGGSVMGVRTTRGSILGKTTTTTTTPKVSAAPTPSTELAATPTPEQTFEDPFPAPEEKLNFFQRLIRFLFGK